MRETLRYTPQPPPAEDPALLEALERLLNDDRANIEAMLEKDATVACRIVADCATRFCDCSSLYGARWSQCGAAELLASAECNLRLAVRRLRDLERQT